MNIYNDLKITIMATRDVPNGSKFITVHAMFSDYKTCQYRISLAELCEDEGAGQRRKMIAEYFARKLFTNQIHDILITALMKAAIAGEFKP